MSLSLFKSPSSREVVDLLKTLVNTGKTYRRHIVELPQGFEHGKAYLLALHFGPQQPGPLFYSCSQRFELLGLDRPVLACCSGAGYHLAPVKGLTPCGPLDDPQHCLAHPLDSCEPTRA